MKTYRLKQPQCYCKWFGGVDQLRYISPFKILKWTLYISGIVFIITFLTNLCIYVMYHLNYFICCFFFQETIGYLSDQLFRVCFMIMGFIVELWNY